MTPRVARLTALLLGTLAVACRAPSAPSAPCPSLRHVIGHAYDVRTCRVIA